MRTCARSWPGPAVRAAAPPAPSAAPASWQACAPRPVGRARRVFRFLEVNRNAKTDSEPDFTGRLSALRAEKGTIPHVHFLGAERYELFNEDRRTRALALTRHTGAGAGAGGAPAPRRRPRANTCPPRGREPHHAWEGRFKTRREDRFSRGKCDPSEHWCISCAGARWSTTTERNTHFCRRVHALAGATHGWLVV